MLIVTHFTRIASQLQKSVNGCHPYLQVLFPNIVHNGHYGVNTMIMFTDHYSLFVKRCVLIVILIFSVKNQGFFQMIKKGKTVTKNCAWLDKKSGTVKNNFCVSGKTDGVYPPVYEACPMSCNVTSCSS